jgi:L-ascorbate metabolism protein UlaG (beta-lactamase superfamily)
MIEYHNKTLFFWGDGIIYNGLIERLIQKNFDYFFAPINGRDKLREQQGIVGNLKARELAELCKILHIKKVIPNHYDMFKNNTESIEYFNKCIQLICPDQKSIILSCGEKIDT